MKRFLCLLLAMILVLFTLAGCNNETASTSEDDESETEKEVSEESGDAVKLGMSIKDPSALLSMLMGGEADLDIKDIYVDMTANESSELVYALGAKLFGKSHSVKLFAGKDIILSAPTLLDKSYGISYEAFLAMFSDMMNKVTAPGANSGSVNVQELAEPALRMVEKYSEMLLTELRTNAGLTVHRPAGAKYVQISGKMTTDNLATILVNFIEELCKDEDFFTILKAVRGMTKEQFLQGKPSKDALLSGLKQELKPLAFEADVNLTVDDEQGITKADIKAGFMIREKAELELKFDLGAKSFDFYFKPAEDSVIRFKFDNGDLNAEFSMTNKTEMVHPGFYDESRSESKYASIIIKDKKLTFAFEDKEETNFKSHATNGGSNTTRESMRIDAEATWSDSGVKFSFTKKDSEYDSSYGKEEENILSAKGEFKISDTGMVMSFEYDDESTQPISMEMRISIGDEIKGTITANGQKMGEVILEKKVSGSKTTITLKSIDMGGAKLDLADAGISFYINTAAAMPKAPEYTSIENFTEEDFEAIGEKFMKDNAELIEKLSGMFGGMGGATAVPNRPAVNNGAAQEMPGSAWN